MTSTSEAEHPASIWLRSALFGAAALALTEGVLGALSSPLARASLDALLLSVVAACAAFFVFAAPLAMLAALLEKRFAVRLLRLVPPGPVVLGATVVGIGVAALGQTLHQQVDPDRFEFLEPVRALANWGLAVGAIFIGLLVHALLSRPRLAAPWMREGVGAQLLAALSVLIAIAALVVLHFGPSSVYNHTLDSAATLMVIPLCVLGFRLLAGRLRLSPKLTVLASLLALMLGALAARHPAGSYLLITREPAAAAASSWLRRALDFDGDGSVATLLGGADCAPWRADVGPGMRKTPQAPENDCRPALPSAAPAQAEGPYARCVNDFKARPGPQRIVVITLDALRADTFAAQSPPVLQEFVAHSAYFTRAYSPSPSTYTSVPALFSGKPTSDLTGPNVLVDLAVLAQHDVVRRFRDAGYQTIGVSLLKGHELGDGFQRFSGFAVDPPAPGGGKADYYSGALAAQAAQRVAAAGDSPLFLWLHQIDPHAPYSPIDTDTFPKPEGSHYERAVAYSLLRTAELVTRLLKHPNTVIALTADHGEELGRNGRHGHGPELTEDVLRVPLVLHVPGCPGATVAQPVSIVDLGPTLLKLAALGNGERSLLSALDGTPAALPVVAEGLVPGRVERALILGQHKLRIDVGSGARVAFDLRTDPGETHNLYGTDAALSDNLDAAYDRWQSRNLPRLSSAAP